MKRAFISYSHRDQALRAELDAHLALLKREGALDVWTDHRIPAGGDIDASISGALEKADIVLLLISSDFVASDYCFGVEMRRALERNEAGECIVVPIILRPCDWKTAPFGGLKALPSEGKAVIKWASHDEAFDDIVANIRRLLTAPPSRSAAHHGQARLSASNNEDAGSSPLLHRVARSSNLALPQSFSDKDKYDFVLETVSYIRDYFANSLKELEERNAAIQTRMTEPSPHAFTAIVFRDGMRIAGCHIRYGGGHSPNSIAYSASEVGGESSYNELLMPGVDAQKIYLTASMALFHGGDSREKLTQEGAAEHLWSMFIRPVQQLSGRAGGW